jgi:hypothetical protein
MRSTAESIRIASRRAKIARMVLSGVTNQYELCARLGLDTGSQPTISRDLAWIREQWRLSATQDLTEALGRELAKLEMMCSESLDAWERSRQPRESTRARIRKRNPPAASPGQPAPPAGPTEDMSEIRKEVRDGNPRFLEIAMLITDRILRLLGLGKITDMTVPPAPTGCTVSDEDRERIREAILDKLDRRLQPSRASTGPAPVPVVIEGPPAGVDQDDDLIQF